jgi:preprotein translocase subunit SecG
LGAAFIVTSITLTVIVAQKSAGSSVIDRLGATLPPVTQTDPSNATGDDLLPPSASDNAPLVPAAD